MSRKPRRVKPSTRADRKRVSELSGILGNARTAKEEKAAALAKLNYLAPYESEVGSSSDFKESKPMPVSTPAPSRTPSFSSSETDKADVQKMGLRETQAEWHKIISHPWPEHGWEQLAARCNAIAWRQAVLRGETTLRFSEWHTSQTKRAGLPPSDAEVRAMCEKHGLTK
jgi:hypothetical protein